ERVDDRLLEGRRDVRERLPLELRDRAEAAAPRVLALQAVQHGGLEAAEAEVERASGEQRARERVRLGIAALRRALDRRPAGVGEPEERRDLVERLARRVVLRLAEEVVVGRRAVAEELGVAAAHDQREER